MWPFGGSRALAYFADKKNEDHDEEEAHHLLGNVIDSDDEQVQADALSPDQIKRFLDASKSTRSATSNISNRPRESRMPGPSSTLAHRTSASTKAAVEYDELFDEELEDEPENFGAGKNWSLEDPASFSPVDTGGRGLGFGRADFRSPKLANGQAQPLASSSQPARGSRKYEDDEDDKDDEEVAGPPIMLPASPSFLPPQMGFGGLSQAAQALPSFPQSNGLTLNAGESVKCSTERLEASGMLDAWDGDSIVLDGDAGHFVEVPEATAVK